MSEGLPTGCWALVLGGSSGFGLATARELAARGVNLCLVHRDRRAQLREVEPVFEKLRGQVKLRTHNVDALDPERRAAVLEDLASALGEGEGVRLLLHSIAFGTMRLLAPETPRPRTGRAALAEALGVEEERLAEAADRLLKEGADDLADLASPPAYPGRLLRPQDFARTVHAMGTSLAEWAQDLHARGLFTADARVLGMTSEGNRVAWKGYAAVSAAKTALEAVARSLAVELAPAGVRCNVVQAGVTETPALAAIPGSDRLKARSRLRNPFGRLTTPEDVARAIYLLCRDEAAWINGEVVRVDGGEHVSGGAG